MMKQKNQLNIDVVRDIKTKDDVINIGELIIVEIHNNNNLKQLYAEYIAKGNRIFGDEFPIKSVQELYIDRTIINKNSESFKEFKNWRFRKMHSL